MTIKPSAGRPYLPSRSSTSSQGARQPLRAVPAEVRQETKPSSPPLEDGFAQHLKDAIALNRSRRDVYDRLSGGGTRSLSNQLIMLENLTLPAAYALDLWAKRFQKQGIPVMQEDFVSMQDVRSPFAPPRWRGVASDQDAAEVEGWLKTYRETIRQAVGKNDFAAIAEASHGLLERLEATEQAKQTHWAMTKHLIESLGLAAMNAIDHAARSDGETLTLSRTFLRFQSLGLMGSVSVDRKAQTFHQKGIGILVNDVPLIPFAERWEARR
ncbi:hypothetical protein D3C72_196920 [compost metagenome]